MISSSLRECKIQQQETSLVPKRDLKRGDEMTITDQSKRLMCTTRGGNNTCAYAQKVKLVNLKYLAVALGVTVEM